MFTPPNTKKRRPQCATVVRAEGRINLFTITADRKRKRQRSTVTMESVKKWICTIFLSLIIVLLACCIDWNASPSETPQSHAHKGTSSLRIHLIPRTMFQLVMCSPVFTEQGEKKSLCSLTLNQALQNYRVVKDQFGGISVQYSTHGDYVFHTENLHLHESQTLARPWTSRDSKAHFSSSSPLQHDDQGQQPSIQHRLKLKVDAKITETLNNMSGMDIGFDVAWAVVMQQLKDIKRYKGLVRRRSNDVGSIARKRQEYFLKRPSSSSNMSNADIIWNSTGAMFEATTHRLVGELLRLNHWLAAAQWLSAIKLRRDLAIILFLLCCIGRFAVCSRKMRLHLPRRLWKISRVGVKLGADRRNGSRDKQTSSFERPHISDILPKQIKKKKRKKKPPANNITCLEQTLESTKCEALCEVLCAEEYPQDKMNVDMLDSVLPLRKSNNMEAPADACDTSSTSTNSVSSLPLEQAICSNNIPESTCLTDARGGHNCDGRDESLISCIDASLSTITVSFSSSSRSYSVEGSASNSDDWPRRRIFDEDDVRIRGIIRSKLDHDNVHALLTAGRPLPDSSSWRVQSKETTPSQASFLSIPPVGDVTPVPGALSASQSRLTSDASGAARTTRLGTVARAGAHNVLSSNEIATAASCDLKQITRTSWNACCTLTPTKEQREEAYKELKQFQSEQITRLIRRRREMQPAEGDGISTTCELQRNLGEGATYDAKCSSSVFRNTSTDRTTTSVVQDVDSGEGFVLSEDYDCSYLLPGILDNDDDDDESKASVEKGFRSSCYLSKPQKVDWATTTAGDNSANFIGEVDKEAHRDFLYMHTYHAASSTRQGCSAAIGNEAVDGATDRVVKSTNNLFAPSASVPCNFEPEITHKFETLKDSTNEKCVFASHDGLRSKDYSLLFGKYTAIAFGADTNELNSPAGEKWGRVSELSQGSVVATNTPWISNEAVCSNQILLNGKW